MSEATVRATSPRQRRTSRLASVLPILVIGGIAALAFARFITLGNNDHPTRRSAAPTAAAAASSDRIAALEAKTAQNPNDIDSWSALVPAYVTKAALTGDPAWYGPADKALARATALAPDGVSTNVAAGSLHLSRHEFAAARTSADRALATAPTNASALTIAVDASVELGDYDGAAAILQTLLDRRPDDAALARASYLRELHGDIPGALSGMERSEAAAAANPDRAAVLATFTGDLLLGDGDVAGATAAYNRAHLLSPGLLSAELGRVRTQAAAGDPIGALAAAKALTERSPQPAVAILLGDLARWSGDEKQAAQADELVRASTTLLAANGVEVDLESAVFEADHGAAATSLTLAQKAYDIRHTVFTADALAWALTKSGRARDALPYVAESLTLGTENPQVLIHAAVATDASGNSAQATTLLTKALTRGPWFVLGLRSDATALAGRLGLSVPPAWSAAS